MRCVVASVISFMLYRLQHSAVIEIFPYYMKKQTYAYLAGTMGHFYFPMYSWTSG